MDTHEQRQAAYDLEVRAKYTQAQIDALGAKGEAYKNPDGHYSYPIADAEDLSNAIRAVGRGGADHDSIRKYVIGRAKALGKSSEIPENWNADGSLKEQNADETELEHREADPDVECRRQRAEMLDGVREERRFDASSVELREASDGVLRFSGYASVTERAYEVGDFEETIARGAFKRTLSEQPHVILTINHGEGGQLPLASTKSGTLTLSEDARGLRVDADLNPLDPDVQRLRPKLERGDVSEMSFAFRVTDDKWNEDYTRRLVRSVGLHKGDVSVVTFGANDASTGSISGLLRSATDLLETRAGKTLSAKSRAEIQASIDALSGLLDGSDVVEEAPSPSGDALDAFDAQVVDGERAAEDDTEAREAPAEAPAPVFIPDHTTRARERLAALRRVA